MEDQVVVTPKSAPAAINRYIYDGKELVRMPHPSDGLLGIINQVVSTPLLYRSLPGIAMGFLSTRPSNITDESIASFLRRNMGPVITEEIVSGVMHGIYAGDIDTLSARSLLGDAWRLESKYGSLLKGFLQKEPTFQSMTISAWLLSQSLAEHDPAREAVERKLAKCSIYSFRRGMETLPRALVKALEGMPNVEIRTNTMVEFCRPVEDRGSFRQEVSK